MGTLSQQNSSTFGIGAARDWIYEEMQGYAEQGDGSMEVYFDSYIQGVGSRIPFPVNITNVVARINGTEDSNRTYVVTGHYDSRRLDVMDYTGDAPGADDDASGVAVLMEMARVVAKMGKPHQRLYRPRLRREHLLPQLHRQRRARTPIRRDRRVERLAAAATGTIHRRSGRGRG